MDYRALGELIWFAFLGLSVFTVTTGLVLRFVLKPLVQDLVEAYRERSDRLGEGETAERLARLERHLIELDGEVDGIKATTDFERRLGAGDPA